MMNGLYDLKKLLNQEPINHHVKLQENIYIKRPGNDDSFELETIGEPIRENRPKLIISGLKYKELAWMSLQRPNRLIIPLTDLDDILNKKIPKDCTYQIDSLQGLDYTIKYKDEKLIIDFFENHYELPEEKVDLIKKELEAYQLFERLKPYIVNMLKID